MMKWLNKLERKYRRFAIHGLMNYIVTITGVVFVLMYLNPLILSKLILIPSLVLKGEVWRLITFIFIPPTNSLIFVFFALYFYSIVGASLENVWGSFRFNVYYLVGVLGTIAVSFITGQGATPDYINLSLFLAFATLFPDFEILLFFFLPLKVRYLSWMYWIYIVWTILTYPLVFKLAAIISLLNYFLFFGKDIFQKTKRKYRHFKRSREFNSSTRGKVIPFKNTIHRCTVCGITEKDDPEMEFRYCSKCDGEYEYCMNHLYNHEHIKKDNKDSEK